MYIGNGIDNKLYKIVRNGYADYKAVTSVRNNKCYKQVSFNNWVYNYDLATIIPKNDEDWFMEVFIEKKGRLKVKIGDTTQVALDTGEVGTWHHDTVTSLYALREFILYNMGDILEEKPIEKLPDEDEEWHYIVDNDYPKEETLCWVALNDEVHRAKFIEYDWYDCDNNMHKLERNNVYAWKKFEIPNAPEYR